MYYKQVTDMNNRKSLIFKEELFSELLFQGLILVDFDQGLVFNTSTHSLMGYLNNTGYIALAWKYERVVNHILAHRLIWMAAYGPIPYKLQINHINGIKTDNRLFNLEVVTNQQNVMHAYSIGLNNSDKIKSGLKEYYTNNVSSCAKLSKDQVRKIIALRDEDPKKNTYRALAKTYDISHSTVIDIMKGRAYKAYTSN